MGLPWVRLDSNIASHDKILAVLQEKEGAKAAWMYVCGLGWSGGHGTDGHIPFHALPFIHGTKRLADLAVDYGLWQRHPDGWLVPRWGERQEMSMKTEEKKARQSAGGRKGNCIRYHGPECGCWLTDA